MKDFTLHHGVHNEKFTITPKGDITMIKPSHYGVQNEKV